MSFSSEKRTILFTGYVAMGCVLTFEQFRQVADAAKAAGFTHVDLGSAMCDRSRWQLDNGGAYAPGYDFYTEYTAAFADPFKFVCPTALREFLPTADIAANGEELRRRAAYLAQIGLKGCLIGAWPQWLPEAVYSAHPEWRGPRCDMPFRSRRAYFAPCVDQPDVLALYREAARGIHELAPNFDTFIFMTNDSGTSMCWNQDSYPGMNGPAACRGRSMTDRVTGFLNALEEGLDTPDALAYNAWQGFWCFSGMLSPHAGNTHGERIWFVRPPQDKPVIHENPLGMLTELENAAKGRPDIIVVNVEQAQQTFRQDGVYVRMLQKFARRPTDGFTDRLLFLKEFIAEWKLDTGNRLLDAWVSLYRGVDDTSLRRLFYYSIFLYGCMSARFLVRPLVPRPEKLTEEEKAYYKRHVFDSLDRQDYELDLLNIHGLRNEFHGRTKEEAERSAHCWDSVIASWLTAESNLVEALKVAPSEFARAHQAQLLRGVRTLLCFARNLKHCELFQAMLDRAGQDGYGPNANSDKLEVIMRQEFDNAGDLIRILEEPDALSVLPLAPTPEKEHTFLFGPNLAGQLREKRRLMLKYWRDSQVLFDFKNRFH